MQVVILGDSHIGKTSLVTRFAEGYYRENSRPATVGAFFVTKRIQSSDGVPTKVQIWDTAGADNFRAMAPMFYKNAAAVIVCYDVTRRESFEGMRGWLDEVRRKVKVGEDVVVAIAALKTDLLHVTGDGASNLVPEREVQQLAEALGVIYLPTSAKTNRNVNALFQCVTDRVLQYRMNASILARQNNNGGAAIGGDGGSNTVLLDRDDLTNSLAATDDDGRVKLSSPRKRDQFDKYYVSNDDQQGSSAHGSDRNDAAMPLDESIGGGGAGGPKKRDGAGTPSTDGTSTVFGGMEGDDDDDGHPLYETPDKKGARGGKKKKGGSDPSSGGRGGMCADDSFYSCQPVACGAGDGATGCTIQ